MSDSKATQIGECLDELLEKTTGLFFFEFVFRGNVAEKFAIAAVFHDEEQAAWSFDYLVKLDDVRMAHYFEDMDFARNPLHIINICYLVFLQNFNSNLFIQEPKRGVTFVFFSILAKIKTLPFNGCEYEFLL